MFNLVLNITEIMAAIICGGFFWYFRNKEFKGVHSGISILVGAIVIYCFLYLVAFLICLFVTKGHAI